MKSSEAINVSGFIAQLVRASHRYREVTGSNPVEVLNYSGFSTQLLKFEFITARTIDTSLDIVCVIKHRDNDHDVICTTSI